MGDNFVNSKYEFDFLFLYFLLLFKNNLSFLPQICTYEGGRVVILLAKNMNNMRLFLYNTNNNSKK